MEIPDSVHRVPSEVRHYAHTHQLKRKGLKND
jgi:hypothetical protein